MVIKASASAEIRLLVDALTGPDDVRREGAAARLSVIGARAVERLLAAYGRAGTEAARVTILRVIEPMKDARAMDPARAALQEGGAVGVAAAQVLRGLLDAPEHGVRGGALDALVAVSLDPAAPHDVRLAVSEILREDPADVRAGVGEVTTNATGAAAERAESAGEAAMSAWTAALEGRLPEQASVLLQPLREHAAGAPLTGLLTLVEALRLREGGGTQVAPDWTALRGTVHHALAVRGSRVALYDLRESFAAAKTPLPVSFLSAVHAVGDRSCLEPLAQAYAQAPGAEDWWRQQLAAAFEVVMMREKLTKRSALVKKVLTRWPGIERAGARQ